MVAVEWLLWASLMVGVMLVRSAFRCGGWGGGAVERL